MARILIIEDEVEMRRMMSQLFELQHFDVVTVADGSEGLRRLKTEAFDLVITDILMAQVDGLEVIQTIPSLSPSIPVIAISGGGHNSAELYLDLACKLGARVVLSKPFPPSRLLSAVRDLLEGSKPCHSGAVPR